MPDKDYKYDSGKLTAGVLEDFGLALSAIAQSGHYGTLKYLRGSWQEVNDAIRRYRDAKWRHRLAYLSGEECDKNSGLPHRWHELWNDMAELELTLRNTIEEETITNTYIGRPHESNTVRRSESNDSPGHKSTFRAIEIATGCHNEKEDSLFKPGIDPGQDG